MSSDRPVEFRELPKGTPSTFDMPGIREDLAPTKKRKRVAYKTKGRPVTENFEDRRNEPTVTLKQVTENLVGMTSKYSPKLRKYNRSGK